MNFADIKKSLTIKNGRIQVFLILAACILINLLLAFNQSFFHAQGTFLSSWYQPLTFLSSVFALSIFLIASYSYPQIRNTRLLIAGFAFLTAGLIDWLSLINFNDPAGWTEGKDLNQTLLIRLISGLITAAGISCFISMEDKFNKIIKRRYLALFSLLIFALACVLVSVPLKPEVFIGSSGITPLGMILIVLIAIMYIYSVFRSSREYGRSRDTVCLALSISFLLLFFSGISLMSIRQVGDSWGLISHTYQLAAYLLIIKVFYVKGIRRPYILLSNTKEELDGYLLKLDKLVDSRTTELRCINEKLMADQEIARGMQLSMLPSSLPKNEFVAFASGYVPAEKLSGDFYNVFTIDESRFGFCIGDVSGHGVSAAMLSIFTFQKIQSLMEETSGEGVAIPSQVLKHIYESFNSANFNEDMYIVMLYGVINTQTGIFSYASGGLNTNPLRIRPDGSIQELDNDGFAICKLGNLIKPKFVNHQVLLFPGDKLVLYTDGLTDARNAEDQEYTVDRLKSTILKHRIWGVDHLTESIIRDVKTYTGDKTSDDITVLAVDILPPF